LSSPLQGACLSSVASKSDTTPVTADSSVNQELPPWACYAAGLDEQIEQIRRARHDSFLRGTAAHDALPDRGVPYVRFSGNPRRGVRETWRRAGERVAAAIDDAIDASWPDDRGAPPPSPARVAGPVARNRGDDAPDGSARRGDDSPPLVPAVDVEQATAVSFSLLVAALLACRSCLTRPRRRDRQGEHPGARRFEPDELHGVVLHPR
jgi:hypothetical protein